MGQTVTVIEKPSAQPGVVRFETNRVLSGMGHDRFTSPEQITGDRPVDVIAGKLLERGGITSVHVNGNVITVTLAAGAGTEGIADLIGDVYTYYRPGVEIPSFDAPEGDG